MKRILLSLVCASIVLAAAACSGSPTSSAERAAPRFNETPTLTTPTAPTSGSTVQGTQDGVLPPADSTGVDRGPKMMGGGL